MRHAALILMVAAMCGPALAQQRNRGQTQAAPPKQAVEAPAPAASPTPSPAAPNTPQTAPAANEPQRTTVTYGDWVLRCVRAEHAPPACEVAQTLAEKGQAVAQTVIGRPRAAEPWRIVILVPVNVSLATPPRLAGAPTEVDFPSAVMSWRRCVPNGCIADGILSDDQVQRLRSRTENARVLFQDAAGREAALPVGPHGLSDALDALAKGTDGAAPGSR